jgi:hypothetical protein
MRQAVVIMSGLDADIKGRSELRPDLAIETALSQVMEYLQQR